MASQILVLALAASTVSAGIIGRQACNADYCLRALRATQFPERLSQATEDCKSVLWTTTTLPTITISETSTISTTSTITVPTTLIESYDATATTVVPVTHTVLVPAGVTVTETLTPTVLNAKRTLSAPATIILPEYATPCSGIVRFSSACRCIGVTSQLFTAPAPLTTTTISTTEVFETSTTETVATESTTLTSISSIYTTVDTTTSTVTQTVGIPFQTSTPRAMIYGYEYKFRLLANYQRPLLSSGIVRTSDPAAAVPFALDGYGHLWVWLNGRPRVAKQDANAERLYAAFDLLEFMDPAAPYFEEEGRDYLKCHVDGEGYLKCTLSGVLLRFIQGWGDGWRFGAWDAEVFEEFDTMEIIW